MQKLEMLWKKGKDFLGCDYPILGGAMSYISDSNLVSAISNAGGFGVLAASAMNSQQLSEAIKETKAKTTKIFAVNLILLNPLIEELINTVIKENINYVILAGGIPNKQQVSKLKQNKIKVFVFAPNLPIAKKMIVDYKVDALIIEGSEAGGHIGPVSTLVLVQEILPYIDEVPVFVAGGIGRGEVMVDLLTLGASGIQIGTLFVCSIESTAHINFKQAFIKAKSRNAQPTIQVSNEFPVIPVRAIVNKGTQEFVNYQHEIVNQYKMGALNKNEASMKIEKYWAGSLRKAVVDGDVEYGSLMAGQAVGFVDCIKPVSEIINTIIKQAEQYIFNKIEEFK